MYVRTRALLRYSLTRSASFREPIKDVEEDVELLCTYIDEESFISKIGFRPPCLPVLFGELLEVPLELVDPDRLPVAAGDLQEDDFRVLGPAIFEQPPKQKITA